MYFHTVEQQNIIKLTNTDLTIKSQAYTMHLQLRFTVHYLHLVCQQQRFSVCVTDSFGCCCIEKIKLPTFWRTYCLLQGRNITSNYYTQRTATNIDRHINLKYNIVLYVCSLFYRSLALLVFILATYFSTVLARRVSRLL